MDTLKERYSRGEISREEFERMKKDMGIAFAQLSARRRIAAAIFPFLLLALPLPF
jgi:hypothetical protein